MRLYVGWLSNWHINQCNLLYRDKMNPFAFMLNAISMQLTSKWVPPTKCVYFIWLTSCCCNWKHHHTVIQAHYVFFFNSETFIIMFMILGQERSWRSSVSVQVPLLGHNRAVHRTLWMRSIIATFGPSFHPLWSLGRLWMHNLIMQGMKYC